MRTRSRARGGVLRLLYEWDTRGKGTDPTAALSGFLSEHRVREETAAYMRRLVDTIVANLEAIDRELQDALTNWRIERLAVIDRNILRIGAAELLHHADVPPRAAIQEAILLAEKYGTAESPRFVNGVLDALMHRPRGAGVARPGETR
jgi:N utilization substance protein B